MVWHIAGFEWSTVQRALELELEGGCAIIFTRKLEFPAIGFDQVERPKEPYRRDAGIGRFGILDHPGVGCRGLVNNLFAFKSHELIDGTDFEVMLLVRHQWSGDVR